MPTSLIIFGIVLAVILVVIKILLPESDHDKTFNEWSYQRFSRFMGENTFTDKAFNKKMYKIKKAILNEGMDNIEEIAEYAECSYDDCIMKIKYLKNKRIIGDYFIDKKKKIIRKLDLDDSNLLKKYHDDIYYKHLQVDEIAKERSKIDNRNVKELEEEIFKDIKYLYDKEIINGIILNEEDKSISYYTLEKKKTTQWYNTLNCPKCGALVDVPKGSSERCEYCNSIVEDKQEVK